MLSICCGGAAQAAALADSTSRRYPMYIGAQAAALRFAGLGQTDADGQPLSYRGLIPTLGYRLSRRTGVEMAILWRGKTAGPTTVVAYPNGDLYRYYDSYQSWVVPIVARIALLPRLRRWSVEGVAGFSVLHSRIEGNRSMTAAGQPAQPFEIAGFTEANDLPLALGAGIAYTPTPHWTLRAETRLNWSLLGSAAAAVFFGGVYLPQAGFSAGVQYNFIFKDSRKI